MKPGYKTTEFWVSVAAALYSALLANHVIPTDSPVTVGVNVAATVAIALGYTAARAFIKSRK